MHKNENIKLASVEETDNDLPFEIRREICSMLFAKFKTKLKNQLFDNGRYTYGVYENCLIFKKTHPSVHLRPKFFYPLDHGRPILNELPLSNKLCFNNRTVHVNEGNQNKNKTKSRHFQIDHVFYCTI